MPIRYANEDELIAHLLTFADDPAGFVYTVYPWQIEELEAMAEYCLRQKFALDHDLPLDIFRAAYSSGRGPGKSALFGMASHWLISTHIGAQAIVAANTETQLRAKTFPEFGRWFTSAINSHWFVMEALRISIVPWLADLAAKHPTEGGRGIDPKYWNVIGQTWTEENPSAFAGSHNPYGLLVGFDEASGIPAPVWDTADGFFTDRSVFRAFLAASQMRENQGRFFELFNNEKIGKGWGKRCITIRDFPGVDQKWVRDQIDRYGEGSDFVRVEIDGMAPRTSSAQFIASEYARSAEENVFSPNFDAPLLLGVDPAPRGITAWRFRQGQDARACCGKETMGKLYGKDNHEIASEVMRLDAKYRPDAICIDFGMGTGVIDILKRVKLWGKLVEVKFGESPMRDGEAGSRACELWCEMRDWLPNGMIERDPDLFAQLTDRGWKWSGREDGKKVLESKDDLKRRGVKSPDDADALACTFAVPMIRRRRNETEAIKPRIVEGVSSAYGW